MTEIAPGFCHAERSEAACAAKQLAVCWDTILRGAQDARRGAQDARRSGSASAQDDRQRGSYGDPLVLALSN